MKKLFVALLMIAGLQSFAQKMKEVKAPSPAQSAFSKNFPGINDVKWEKEKGNYEAHFMQGDRKVSATFDANGTLMETEMGLDIKSLPPVIKDYVTKNYAGAEIKEVSSIQRPNATMMFEVEINGKDLMFGPNGQFISATSNKETK